MLELVPFGDGSGEGVPVNLTGGSLLVGLVFSMGCGFYCLHFEGNSPSCPLTDGQYCIA